MDYVLESTPLTDASRRVALTCKTLIVILTALSGCDLSSPTEIGRMQSNNSKLRCSVDDSLSLAIPTDWNIWEAPPGLVFLASAPELSKTFEPQVSVTSEEVAESSDGNAYLVGNYALLKNRTSDFKERGSGGFATQNLQVAWIEYSSSVETFEVTSIDFYFDCLICIDMI